MVIIWKVYKLMFGLVLNRLILYYFCNNNNHVKGVSQTVYVCET